MHIVASSHSYPIEILWPWKQFRLLVHSFFFLRHLSFFFPTWIWTKKNSLHKIQTETNQVTRNKAVIASHPFRYLHIYSLQGYSETSPAKLNTTKSVCRLHVDNPRNLCCNLWSSLGHKCFKKCSVVSCIGSRYAKTVGHFKFRKWISHNWETSTLKLSKQSLQA